MDGKSPDNPLDIVPNPVTGELEESDSKKIAKLETTVAKITESLESIRDTVVFLAESTRDQLKAAQNPTPLTPQPMDNMSQTLKQFEVFSKITSQSHKDYASALLKGMQFGGEVTALELTADQATAQVGALESEMDEMVETVKAQAQEKKPFNPDEVLNIVNKFMEGYNKIRGGKVETKE